MSIVPAITVICTCYNKGPWIEEVLASILNQKTSFSFDVLVVDDGSSDGSADTIRRIAETNPEKVTALFHEKNQGISSTWKEACPLAQGEWIARCDGDDPWIREDKLQLQMDELNKTGYLWSTTDFEMKTHRSIRVRARNNTSRRHIRENARNQGLHDVFNMGGSR